MTVKLAFVERKASSFVSIERVFRHVNDALDDSFDTSFVRLPFDNSLVGLIKNLLSFKRPESDIYHITGHSHYIALRLPSNRTVLTVHDLFFMNNRTGIRRWFLKKLYLDWPLKRARYVTAISEATKVEIAKYLPDVAERIVVIENPLDPQFEFSPKEFSFEKPEILQLGTVVNKNVPRLIRALSGLSCRLTLVGKVDEEISSALDESDIEYRTIDRLADDELIDAYKNADIVSFCSTYEGFGLPIIEAQAVGRVVVTSNLSPMKEVAGDGAELVDPFDEASIRAGFDRVIADSSRRNDLIEKGRSNVARFSAKHAAEAYSAIYEQVVADNALH